MTLSLLPTRMTGESSDTSQPPPPLGKIILSLPDMVSYYINTIPGFLLYQYYSRWVGLAQLQIWGVVQPLICWLVGEYDNKANSTPWELELGLSLAIMIFN